MTICRYLGQDTVTGLSWYQAPTCLPPIIGYQGPVAMVKPEERKYCQKRHGGLSNAIKYVLDIHAVFR